MIEVNHEYYVDLEVAELLREAGFNWECDKKFVFYSTICENGTEFARSMCDPTYLPSPKEICIYQPTLEVAQRWLREVKSFEICVGFTKHDFGNGDVEEMAAEYADDYDYESGTLDAREAVHDAVVYGIKWALEHLKQ